VKVFAAPFAAHVALGRTTLATALRITRGDSAVYGFTTHDRSDEIDGVLYSANPGLEISSVVIAANASVGNLELTTLHDETVFAIADIFNGVWRNADFLLFRYSYENLAGGTDPLLAGIISDVILRENHIVAELRDLRQYLQQPVGDVSSKTCRYRLGDARCRKSLVAFTYTGTITSVTSSEVFRDAARAESADWFSEGEITMTSGPSAGVRRKIRSHAAGGTFSVAIPFYSPVEVGNTYTAIAGCRKRLDEDCKTKFDNVVNFGGEPHRRGLNDIIKL